MKVVIDTNVMVSGIMKPYSPSGEILKMIPKRKLIPCFDTRIMAEYENVLGRPKFHFEPEIVAFLLDFFEREGQFCVGSPLPSHLPHHADEAFLEVALAGMVDYLITGNMAHFPAESRAGIKVLTPRQFIDLWKMK